MDAIGYSPEGAKRFYTIGFSASHSGTVAGFSGNLTTNPSYARTSFPASWTTCTPALTGSYPTGAINDPQAFTAVASGQIRDAVGCDQWQINDTKILSNTTVNL